MPPKKFYTLLLVAGLLFAACDQSLVYQSHQTIAPEGWHFEDKLVFETTITDTTSLHNMYVDVRNTTDYGFSNFYIFMNIIFPDGKTLRDTIEFTLADRAGKWTGRGLGKIRSNRFLFRTDVWFPVPGSYRFEMEQAMREEVLAGIADMGLRIEKK